MTHVTSHVSNPVCRILKDSRFLVFHICPTGLREIDSFTSPAKLESPSTAEISQKIGFPRAEGAFAN